MKKIFHHPSLILSCLFSLIPVASAYAHDKAEHRHHGAHEHGHATLNLAQENQTVEIMLESPAINFVGFEHTPQNEQEKQKLKNTLAQLKDGNQIFLFSSDAHCTQTNATVSTGLSRTDKIFHDDNPKAEASGIEEGHADFDATYTFSCTKPSAIKELKVKLFEMFPLTKDIDGQVVTDTKQLGIELSPSNATLQF